jgi:hypothetical protein
MRDEQQAQRQERELVLSEYGTWRITADEDAPAADEIRTLETLLRLKAEQQGSPDPGLWTEQLATALLTEVVPRTVIQPREQAMDMVPTLIRFVTYLRETGRWHPDSMSATEAPGILGGLEFPALEAADDPTRRSFSTNILGHGMDLGVDLEDEDELTAYMHWYNSLPDQERLALSETGRLERPTAPYDRERALREVREERESAPDWPWFLPEPASAERSGLTELELGPEDYAASDFVRAALALLEVVGEGRRLTATEALGRDDTAELLAALGIERRVRSMWDHPEIVAPWITLRDGGWLEVSGDRVRRAPGPVPAVTAQQDPDGFVEVGHALLTALLLGRDAREIRDGGFQGMPDTAASLMIACGADGLPVQPAGAAQRDREEIERWLRVRRDLESLVAAGALTRDGERFQGSGALLVAVAAVVRDRPA